VNSTPPDSSVARQAEANEKRVKAAKEQHEVSESWAGEKKDDDGTLASGVTNGHTTRNEPKRTRDAKAAADAD
jgi:hypothetical protein